MKKVLELIQEALKALEACKATGPRAESIQAHLKSCESNALAEVGLSPKAKEKEKEKEGGFTTVRLLLATMFVGMLMLLAMAVHAASFYQSFSATNYIAGSTTITSFPTNTAGTNGLNQLTGGQISVANQEHVNFVFKTEPVGADATNSITVKLVRGFSSASPQITLNTNSGSWKAFSDWETLPTLTLVFNQNGTNSTTWSTNLDFYIGGAAQLGVYSIQNGQSSAVTNFDLGLVKKNVSITYP